MKILIIEDSVDVLNALKRGFKYKNVKTEHCTDGFSGLEKLKKNNYDLAVLDLNLPILGGEDVLKKVKALGIKTPLLILTANHNDYKKIMMLESGADDFMHKPFTFEELFARIQAILRRTQNQLLTEYIRVGDFELSPEQRTVLKKGGKLDLRGKEYNLMEYFMKHPNQVISRQTLIEKVWGYSISVSSNTVDTYVYKLRKKIEDKKKLIKTIHGVGFMLTMDENF